MKLQSFFTEFRMKSVDPFTVECFMTKRVFQIGRLVFGLLSKTPEPSAPGVVRIDASKGKPLPASVVKEALRSVKRMQRIQKRRGVELRVFNAKISSRKRTPKGYKSIPIGPIHKNCRCAFSPITAARVKRSKGKKSSARKGRKR